MAGPFTLIFHRRANAPGGVAAARLHAAVLQERLSEVPFTWAVEGDVNWVPTPRGFRFFLWHPPQPGVRLADERDADGQCEAGHAQELERLLAAAGEGRLVLELKDGAGERGAAIAAFLDILRTHGSLPRTVVDSYRPGDLAAVKRCAPAAVTSLHTPLALAGGLLATPSPHWRSVSWLAAGDLHGIDAITTFPRPLATISRRLVRRWAQRGTSVYFGGLVHPRLLELAVASGAAGGYVRFLPAGAPRSAR